MIVHAQVCNINNNNKNNNVNSNNNHHHKHNSINNNDNNNNNSSKELCDVLLDIALDVLAQMYVVCPAAWASRQGTHGG